jgi:hypothetical protein
MCIYAYNSQGAISVVYRRCAERRAFSDNNSVVAGFNGGAFPGGVADIYVIGSKAATRDRVGAYLRAFSENYRSSG